LLLAAIDTTGSPAAAWTAMFEARLTEIDVRMQSLTTMRDMLTQALTCNCLTLEQAAVVPQALGWVTDVASGTRGQVGPA